MASFGFGQKAGTTVPPSGSIESSTPWLAASDGNLSLLQRSLLELSLPPFAADENGYTLLHAAASYNQRAVLDWLLSSPQQVNVNAADNDGDTALHHCETVETARFLLETGHADPTIRNNTGKTALEAKEEELQELLADTDNDDEESEALQALVDFLKNFVSARAQ